MPPLPAERSRHKGVFPANKLTRGQALYAYTQGSAYAEFAEKHKGKLAPGYDADFILIDMNIYSVAPPALLSATVLATYVAGRQSYAGTTPPIAAPPVSSGSPEPAFRGRQYPLGGPWGGEPALCEVEDPLLGPAGDMNWPRHRTLGPPCP